MSNLFPSDPPEFSHLEAERDADPTQSQVGAAHGPESAWPDDTSVADRLEYLRGEIRAERISYGEIAELQGLVDHIDPSDVELLEWAGVPEHN
jgi:hypothetical protein